MRSREQQKRRVNRTRLLSGPTRHFATSPSFSQDGKKKRCWISIQQRFRLGTECLIVSSFSTNKFGVHQNCAKIKQPPPPGQLAFTLVVHRSTQMGRVLTWQHALCPADRRTGGPHDTSFISDTELIHPATRSCAQRPNTLDNFANNTASECEHTRNENQTGDNGRRLAKRVEPLHASP
jgi:hypothetical protein